MSVPLTVLAPVSGRVLVMAQVPDPVFAESMVGPGLAIDPDSDAGAAVAVAPVAGKILKLHPHAYVIVSESGRGVLVHLGIDTVQLKGEGFRLIASEGDEVSAGAPVVEWDPGVIAAGGRSPVCPVVALDGDAGDVRALAGDGHVDSGAELYAWE